MPPGFWGSRSREGVSMTSSFRYGLVSILCTIPVVSCAFGDEPDKSRAANPASKTLTICAVPASMPRTGKAPDGKPLGLDTAVAERVGRVLGRPVEFHWCAGAECGWHCLPEGRCDVVVGQPADSAPPRTAAWSVPYAGAQFGLVVPRDARDIRSLADLQGKRVGIVAGTVAISEKDHVVTRFPSREALLDGFQAAKLDAAFLDADFAAWYLHEHPKLGAADRRRVRATRAMEHGPGGPGQGFATPDGDQSGTGPARRVGGVAEDLLRSRRAVPCPVHGDRPPAGCAARPGVVSATAASWSSAWTPPTCPTPAPRTIVPDSMWSWRGPWRNVSM